MKRASILVLSAVSGVVLACGSSGTSSGGSSGSGAQAVTDQTLEALASSLCDRIATCYGDFFVKAFIGDTTTCKVRLQIETKASAKGLGVQITDAQGQTCKTGIDAAACNTLLVDGVAACDFRGTLADGAACANDSQCTSGGCFVDPKTTCGKCGPRAAEGADCTNAKCVRGLTCSPAKKCAKAVAEGGTCDANTACEVSLTCIAGKCSKGLANNAACKIGTMETPCDSFTGLYCLPPKATATAGTCAPFTIVGENEACGVTLTPVVDFAVCSGSECIGASSMSKGKCTAFIADGASCDATKPPDCQFPAKCRSGKCATLDPLACK